MKHNSGVGVSTAGVGAVAGSNNDCHYNANSRSSLRSPNSPFKPIVLSTEVLPPDPLASRGRSADVMSAELKAHLIMPSSGVRSAKMDDARLLYARVQVAVVPTD